MKMKSLLLTTLTFLFMAMSLNSMANTQTQVSQQTTPVTLNDDVDYIITSGTPFADDGSIDIVNTEHAVVILASVKPSAAIKLLSHITINGAAAKNGTNCQVKLYNRGCIILPYAKDFHPLTVYSEPQFEGTAVNSFGTENSGGFMNTLTDEKLNNRIRSFKLKRGYMVTFSTLPLGRGYSRCFIAADKDLEVAELPEVLDKRISSYRIFKWYDTGKAAIANDTRAEVVNKLNVTSCYSFGLGEDRGMDCECVPHHIHESWPAISACGQVTYSPHLKTNNEPRNQADDQPTDLKGILANWESLMATGMRLCSPSSWDGSDYWNGTGFLREFFDSIDARGWRCDIIDLHCYWPENNFGNIKNWVNAVHRPVWISEWVWGASWNSNGAFASGVTESQNAAAVKRICTNLNQWDYVERYFYWNSERDPSRIYKDGKLTATGEYYATVNSGVGYNGKYEFVPTAPRQYPPSKFKVSYEGNTATVSWYDANGEYNQLMQLERKERGGQWQVIATISQKETASSYTYKDDDAPEDALYRLHLVDLNGRDRYTDNSMEAGDAITGEDGETRYVGGNLLANGDFDYGTEQWISGSGTALGQPYFQAVPVGGIDGGSYLQAYGSAGPTSQASLKTAVALQPNTDYLFRCASRNGGTYQRVHLCPDENTAVADGNEVLRLENSSDWLMQSATFNSGENTVALIAFRWLGAKAQFDKMELRPLFANRDDAAAHGVASSAASQLLADSVLRARSLSMIDSLLTVSAYLLQYDLPGHDELEALTVKAGTDLTLDELVATCQQLSEAVANYCPMAPAETQPLSPNFNASTGWQVKTGTYTGGDQRLNTYGGKNCWNAWWSNINASVGTKQNMGIRQRIEKLPEGLYSLECKGSTQHYCLSDQHGYMVYDGDTLNTPNLTADYMDLPTVANIWQTLTTPPVYVAEGGTVTIGFTGSKQGAVNNAWHAFGDADNKGDRREGWWCATDFQLLFHPMKKIFTTPGVWSTLCMSYASVLPAGARFYQIAGVLKDHSAICLEQLTELPAGKPVIYQSDTEFLTFCGYGEKAEKPLSYQTQNNLRGVYDVYSKAPTDSYVLINNTWQKVGTDRPRLVSFTAFINKLEGITELDSWDGVTIPLDHNPYTDIITTPRTSDTKKAYHLLGRPTNQSSGIIIETDGRGVRKVVRKQKGY